MNIFFIAQAPSSDKDATELAKILRFLQRQRKNQNISISYQLYEQGKIANDHYACAEYMRLVDAIIVDITHPQPPVYDMFAFALMFSKPVQCLYQHNSPPNELLTFLEKQNTMPSLQISPYSKTNISKILRHFIWNVAHPHFRALQEQI